MNPDSRQSLSRNAALAAALWLACGTIAVAADSKGYNREEVVDRWAIVTAIDAKTRNVTLKTDEGDTVSVYAGPEVRNFAQIKVSDRVEVHYKVAIAAEIAPAEQGTAALQPKVNVERSEAGGQPYAKVGAHITTTVHVTAVDTNANTVTFKRDDGTSETLAVEDANARKFLKTVKPGDFVKVSYTEAVAISVKSEIKK